MSNFTEDLWSRFGFLLMNPPCLSGMEPSIYFRGLKFSRLERKSYNNLASGRCDSLSQRAAASPSAKSYAPEAKLATHKWTLVDLCCGSLIDLVNIIMSDIFHIHIYFSYIWGFGVTHLLIAQLR